MKLYDYLPSGNSYKVRLLLSYLDMDYDWVNLNIIDGQTRTDDFMALNPVGQIPVLELDDGRTIAESNAILHYLGASSELWPEGRYDQAKALQWMFFEQYKHEPSIAVARFIRNYFMESRADELPSLMERGYLALDIMEAHLAQTDWFAGARRSLADISLYAYTHVADAGGFDLSRYVHIMAWLERMRDHPRHILIKDKPK